jgi:hypothetical protein
VAGLTWDVQIRLGGGDDTLALAGPGGGQTIFGRVDFGGQVVADTFTHALTWTLDPVGFRAVNVP